MHFVVNDVAQMMAGHVVRRFSGATPLPSQPGTDDLRDMETRPGVPLAYGRVSAPRGVRADKYQVRRAFGLPALHRHRPPGATASRPTAA